MDKSNRVVACARAAIELHAQIRNEQWAMKVVFTFKQLCKFTRVTLFNLIKIALIVKLSLFHFCGVRPKRSKLKLSSSDAHIGNQLKIPPLENMSVRTNIFLIFGLIVMFVPSIADAQISRSQDGSVSTLQRSVRPRQPGGRQVVDAQEAKIGQQIRVNERRLQQAEQLLQKRLAAAEQVRQRAIRDNNNQLFKEAEQIELQAAARYGLAVKYFEKFGMQLQVSTKAHARSKLESVAQPPYWTNAPTQEKRLGEEQRGSFWKRVFRTE